MGERHTKGGLHHRPQHEKVTVEADATRTGMTRASDGRPPVFYDPARGRDEPPAVIAARQRHRAVNAEIERRTLALDAEAMPDGAPGYEWYRELADD